MILTLCNGMITKFLHVYPSSLKIPFQLNKVSTCSMQLTNISDRNVAFNVKTTRPRKYQVKPSVGIVSPGSTCVVKVVMQAQTKAPARRSTKDKFLVQSIIAPTSLGVEHISEMFRKAAGNVIEEYKLTVVLVSANPPSPIPEASEESSSSDRSELEYAVHQNHWMILLNDSDGCPHFFSLGWFLNKCGKTFFYRYLNQSTKTSYMYLTSVSIRRYVPVTHLHPDDF
ncbi:hypothetical protein Dimus_000462 [Dionaea muscipula]